MRLRTLGVASVLAAGLFQQSGAVVRPKGAEAPVVAADRGARTHRVVEWSQSRDRGARTTRLAARGLSGWSAQWDADTDVPLRMWSAGLQHSGSVTHAETAEAAARQFLAAHIATLAPGSSPSDFELVANQLNPAGDTRTVGFIQRAGGIRVLGGGIGFAFKADRLVMVSSTALPDVKVTAPSSRMAANASRASAITWLGADGFNVVPKGTSTDQVIYPIVRPKLKGQRNIEYKVAEQLEVDAVGQPGTWVVWVDATSGAPIARKTGIRYASGKVLFDVPDRHPASTRSGKGAAFGNFVAAGQSVTSAADGTVTWTGNGAASVQLTPAGPFVNVINDGGSRITETVTLAANGQFLWSKAASELEDAQLNAFVHANLIKSFSKERLNPNLNWLNQSLAVVVNESGSCNAYSTGDDIHFLRSSGNCQNTGRLADVVYHEFGHSLHANSIIPGVGDFESALSEGISDTLAVAVTHDSGMGRGFFHSNAPLRQLNPTNGEKIWGIHTTGESHNDGEVIGGTLWDLKVAMEAANGEAGYDKWLEIMYAIMQRASDIPSSYAEALLADDDDGNLDNGTPNRCAIDAAFASHGLADMSILIGLQAPVRDGNRITIAKPVPANSSCDVATIASASIEWFKLGDTNPPQLIQMEANADGFAADLPAANPGDSPQYRITLKLTDNTNVKLPNNPAEEYYEYFVGVVEPIKCFDFEDGAQGWTNTADWQVGAPEGLAGDPTSAFGGNNALGIDLSNDGKYRSRVTASAESPEIDVAGETKVRLQFRRHLGVEDGVFDQARILVNGGEVWKNFTSPGEDGSTHHTDKEWIFQDIDLSTQAASGKVKLRFELTADQGLELGGWTLDDVCVVRVGEGQDVGDEGEEEGGCCSSSRGAEGALALGVLTLGVVFRRRRRR